MPFKEGEYPTTKEIIYLLGMGTLLTAAVVLPGLGVAAGAIYRAKRRADWGERQKTWKKFNLKLLKRNLKRLQEGKIIEIKEENGQEVIKLTQKGQSKYLKFKLRELSLKGKGWDGKWRLVIYDVSKLKRKEQENFRRMLVQMNFFQLQKSAYLTPYKCREEIEYLREYFNLGAEVFLLEVSKIENEKFFKDYFGV